jgi:hypothetical protein
VGHQPIHLEFILEKLDAGLIILLNTRDQASDVAAGAKGALVAYAYHEAAQVGISPCLLHISPRTWHSGNLAIWQVGQVQR